MHARTFRPALLASFLGLGCGGATATPPKPTNVAIEETTPISGEAASADSATPSTDSAKTYPIRLHRTGRVGARMQLAIENGENDLVVIHDPSGRKDLVRRHVTEHVRLEGIWTTTALDPNGDELRVAIDVAKLTENDAVLLHDKRIELTKGATKEKAVLKVGGKPVSSKIRKALQQLFSFRIDSASSDDALFGSAQPRHVGEHWPIRGDRARADLLAETGATTTDMTGDATLVAVEHVGDLEVLRIKTETVIDGLVLPLHQSGATCDPTQGTSITTSLYPIDEDRGSIEVHSSFVMKAQIHVSAQGRKLPGDVDATTQRDAQGTRL